MATQTQLAPGSGLGSGMRTLKPVTTDPLIPLVSHIITDDDMGTLQVQIYL